MGIVGYASKDELEKVCSDIFAIGTLVKPRPMYIGSDDIFKIVDYNNDMYNLQQMSFNGQELNKNELKNWYSNQLQEVPGVEYPMDVITQQVLTEIKPLYIDKIQNQIIGYDPILSEERENYMKIQNQIADYKSILSEEGENYMKILEIYSTKAFSKIDEKYSKLIGETIEEDNVQKIIEDAENQINVMLDREENDRITINLRSYFEPKTEAKIAELEKQKEAERTSVEKLIEEVYARLELCDDNEYSKVEVLKAYGILTSEEKIAEYKTEKKGKK